MSNAHILHTKSPNNANMRRFDFRRKLVSQLIEGRCLRRDTGSHQIPIPLPNIRFNRDHFHHLVTNDTRSTCKVHVQRVNKLKDGAYYCYCAYVLRTSRYSGFLSVMLTNTEIFLRALKLSGKTGSY